MPGLVSVLEIRKEISLLAERLKTLDDMLATMQVETIQSDKEKLIETAAQVFDVEVHELLSRSSSDYLVAARTTAAYVGVYHLGYTVSQAARVIGRNHATLAHNLEKYDKNFYAPEVRNILNALQSS